MTLDSALPGLFNGAGWKVMDSQVILTLKKKAQPNLFSNKYKNGTKLFNIKNVETSDSIAILDNGTYYNSLSSNSFALSPLTTVMKAWPPAYPRTASSDSSACSSLYCGAHQPYQLVSVSDNHRLYSRHMPHWGSETKIWSIFAIISSF
jgi:hypothetical protein